MNQLINITTNEQGLQVVSARELHSFLEIKKHFTQWFNQQRDWFHEGIDFEALNLKVNSGATDKIDYAITLDMAKELSMMSKAIKGKEVRQYFIECEKKLQSKSLPSNFIESLEALFESKKKEQKLSFELENKTYELEKATEVIKEQAPAVEYTQKVLQSTETYTTTQIAKELDLTADKLYSVLMNRGILFRQSDTYMLYGKYQGKDLTKTRTHQFTGSTGDTRTSAYLVWTEKGREFIHRQVNSNLNYALVHTLSSSIKIS